MVSAAFASDPVKSHPRRKSWVMEGCTMTFKLNDIFLLLSPTKCRMMSAVPVTSSIAPVQVTTTVLCMGLVISMCPFLRSSSKIEVLMTDLAHPESCRAMTFCLLFCLVVELISMEMCANLGFVVESDKKIFDLFPCWLSPVVGSMLAMLM